VGRLRIGRQLEDDGRSGELAGAAPKPVPLGTTMISWLTLTLRARRRSTIQELLSLRRFRAQSSGLALDKLNRGEVRRRKARAAAAGGEGGEEGEEGDGDGGEDGQPKVVAGLVQGKGSKPAEDEYVTPHLSRGRRGRGRHAGWPRGRESIWPLRRLHRVLPADTADGSLRWLRADSRS